MPVSKAQQKAVNKYMAANYDRVNLTLPKGCKEELQAHASARGESVNGFIKRAISETIDRDKAPSQAPESSQNENVSLPINGFKPVPAASSDDTEATDTIPESTRKMIEGVRKMAAEIGGADDE